MKNRKEIEAVRNVIELYIEAGKQGKSQCLFSHSRTGAFIDDVP